MGLQIEEAVDMFWLLPLYSKSLTWHLGVKSP